MRSCLVCLVSAASLLTVPAAAQTPTPAVEPAPAPAAEPVSAAPPTAPVEATPAVAGAGAAPASAPPPAPVAVDPGPQAPPVEDKVNGVTNLQGPVDLQWHALGVLEFPGLGGLRGGATIYTPVVPLYIGFEAARSWGATAGHLAGKRAGFFGREVGGTLTLEARAGLSFERWVREEQDVEYNNAVPLSATQATIYSYHNRIYAPVYHRWSVYGGLRSRSNPGDKPCPTGDLSLPVDCSETTQGFVMAGFETMASQDVEMANGSLTLKAKYTTTWNFNVLVSGKNDYGRTGWGKRIGGEIAYTIVNAGIGVSARAGWDGENVMLSMGLGGGASHAIFRPVPASTTLPQLKAQ
jgi:hypothetical protein